MSKRTLAAALTAASISFTGVAAITGGGAADAARAKPVLRDGEFSTPQNISGSNEFFSPGMKIGPWKVYSGTGVDLNPHDQYPPPAELPDDSQTVDLNGNDASAIRQSLFTVPGQTYEVSYYLSGNPDDTQGPKTAVVKAGSVSDTETYDTTGKSRSDLTWDQHTFEFTATRSRTPLRARSATPGTFQGPLVTGFTVSPTTATE